jgi:kinesin family member C2/C3
LKKDWGVNYRVLNDLFDISQSRRNASSYEVGVQMVEIYNEKVCDLLSNDIAQKQYPFMNCHHFIIFVVLFAIKVQ